MEYAHTQRAPLHYIIYCVALILICFAWGSRSYSGATVVLLVTAGVLVVVALSFRTLTVSDEGQQLSVRFGPIPIFGTSIPYSDITRVESGRSSWIDGWGIHWLPGRGWAYNLWGFSCAVVHLGNTIIRIGTDDVEGLVDFLKQKTGAASGKR